MRGTARRTRIRWAAAAAALVVATLGGRPAEAQVDRRDVPVAAQPQQRFDTGQDVQPIYEGWQRRPDGGITLHFGYLNRNYRERPSAPVGPDNFFAPGDPDRGQPAYFHPRTHRFEFAVDVPGDMGRSFEDGLVWTVRHNGSEQQAVGWLQPEWEIDEDTIIRNTGLGFGRPKEEWHANRPPRVAVAASHAALAVGEPLTLTAVLEDDPLPSPLAPRPPSRRASRPGVPALTPPDGAPEVPDNIPWYVRPRPPRNGLSVHWVVYRGPAGATISPPDYQRSVSEDEAEPAGTQARRYPAAGPRSSVSTATAGDGWTSATFETTVTFRRPGTYVLRARASDGMRISFADVPVAVAEP
ncbi:MAG: hypothetical protein J4F37_08415 [Acidobacteria bacterium]|nr:hypothetical protein [Acidobacteriota bacterium]